MDTEIKVPKQEGGTKIAPAEALGPPKHGLWVPWGLPIPVCEAEARCYAAILPQSQNLVSHLVLGLQSLQLNNAPQELGCHF